MFGTDKKKLPPEIAVLAALLGITPIVIGGDGGGGRGCGDLHYDEATGVRIIRPRTYALLSTSEVDLGLGSREAARILFHVSATTAEQRITDVAYNLIAHPSDNPCDKAIIAAIHQKLPSLYEAAVAMADREWSDRVIALDGSVRSQEEMARVGLRAPISEADAGSVASGN